MGAYVHVVAPMRQRQAARVSPNPPAGDTTLAPEAARTVYRVRSTELDQRAMDQVDQKTLENAEIRAPMSEEEADLAVLSFLK